MRARWKTKARVQRVLAALPGGTALNYRLQRLNGTYPRRADRLTAAVAEARAHLDAVERHHALRRGPAFEFGAGWDLAGPLLFHCLGVEEQVVVDIRPLVRAELVDDLVVRLGADATASGLDRVPAPRRARPLRAYLADLGIDYRAPCDAAAPGLPDGSVAFTTSTNTLEHIPVASLPAILTRSARLLRPGGIASFTVDYEDHFAKSDESISVYNYLRYDERTWRRFSSTLHFQNRLRHSEYRALFLAAGFEILEDETVGDDSFGRAALRSVPLAPRWRDHPEDDLVITGSRFTLRPAPPPCPS